MYKRCPKFDTLPQTVPIFPLEHAILLPRETLPLNIFEPRYVSMVDDALKHNRLIGIIQPKSKDSLYTIGGLGRIVSFTETQDGPYIIHLRGICRFIYQHDLSVTTEYRQAQISYSEFEEDTKKQDGFFKDRACVLNALKSYFEKHHLMCNWETLEDTPDTRLISLLSMICPFSIEEKQALLEAETPCKRAQLLFSLLEIDICHDEKDTLCH